MVHIHGLMLAMISYIVTFVVVFFVSVFAFNIQPYDVINSFFWSSWIVINYGIKMNILILDTLQY